jgi:diguanylate cyclase
MSIIAVPGPVGPRVAFVVVATGWAAHVAVLSRRLSAARLDPVTGLATRAVFEDRAGSVLARRGGLVVLVDQDRFKAVNDTFGHGVGDSVLRRTAWHLTAWAGPRGPVARIGGDEFAVVLPGEPAPGAPLEAALSHLHARLTGPIPETGDDGTVTGASVGAVLAPAGTGLTEALASADNALYQAKKAGTGWVLGALDTDTPRRHKRTGTETEGDERPSEDPRPLSRPWTGGINPTF